MAFDFPSNNNLLNQDGSTSITWLQWFQRVHTIAGSLQQSGTTANRPTAVLWVGRRYFDTTLGKPIWYKGPGWVDATGAAA